MVSHMISLSCFEVYHCADTTFVVACKGGVNFIQMLNIRGGHMLTEESELKYIYCVLFGLAIEAQSTMKGTLNVVAELVIYCFWVNNILCHNVYLSSSICLDYEVLYRIWIGLSREKRKGRKIFARRDSLSGTKSNSPSESCRLVKVYCTVCAP